MYIILGLLLAYALYFAAVTIWAVFFAGADNPDDATIQHHVRLIEDANETPEA